MLSSAIPIGAGVLHVSGRISPRPPSGLRMATPSRPGSRSGGRQLVPRRSTGASGLERRGSAIGLEATALRSVIRNKIRSKFRTLADAFHFFDADRSGDVDKEEIAQALRTFGVTTSSRVLDRIVLDCIGTNTNTNNNNNHAGGGGGDGGAAGLINFKQFIAKLAQGDADTSGDVFARPHTFVDNRGKTKRLSQAEASGALKKHLYAHFDSLNEAFLRFDKTRSGHISAAEFRNMLGSFGIFMSDAEFRGFLGRYDVDHDGRISHAEFTAKFRELLQPKTDPGAVNHLSLHVLPEAAKQMKQQQHEKKKKTNSSSSNNKAATMRASSRTGSGVAGAAPTSAAAPFPPPEAAAAPAPPAAVEVPEADSVDSIDGAAPVVFVEDPTAAAAGGLFMDPQPAAFPAPATAGAGAGAGAGAAGAGAGAAPAGAAPVPAPAFSPSPSPSFSSAAAALDQLPPAAVQRIQRAWRKLNQTFHAVDTTGVGLVPQGVFLQVLGKVLIRGGRTMLSAGEAGTIVRAFYEPATGLVSYLDFLRAMVHGRYRSGGGGSGSAGRRRPQTATAATGGRNMRSRSRVRAAAGAAAAATRRAALRSRGSGL